VLQQFILIQILDANCRPSI